LVLQGGPYKATATAADSFFLCWYCAAAMNVISFMVLFVEIFFCSGVWQF
jgi:hypothetical protein